jgi:putative spermidine/putrescine transport system permease protein
VGSEGPAIGVVAFENRGRRHGHGRGTFATLIAEWAVVLPFVVAIAWLLLGPAANIVLDSIRDAQGDLTLLNWRDVVANPLTRRAIITSMVVGVIIASLTAVIGVPLAWCISRLKIGSRSIGAAALNVAANIPATSLVFGFAAAFGGAGMVTLAMRTVWPDAPTLNIYNPTGLVCIFLYFHVPLFTLLVLPAMSAVSEDLWEAASVCGAGPLRFWRRIGLPVLAPFVLAGWVLMLVWSIGQYGVPLALGWTEATLNLMTLRIGDLIQSVGSNNRFGRAACLSLLLIILSVAALWLYHYLLRRALRWIR